MEKYAYIIQFSSQLFHFQSFKGGLSPKSEDNYLPSSMHGIEIISLITKRKAVFQRYNNALLKHFQIWRKQNVMANFKFLTKFWVMLNTIWLPNYQFCPFDRDVEIFKCFHVQTKKALRLRIFYYWLFVQDMAIIDVLKNSQSCPTEIEAKLCRNI